MYQKNTIEQAFKAPVYLTRILDPFKLTSDTETIYLDWPSPLVQFLPQGFDGLIRINNKDIPRDYWDFVTIFPGDVIILICIPRGLSLLIGVGISLVVAGLSFTVQNIAGPELPISRVPDTRDGKDVREDLSIKGIQTTVGRNVLIPLILGKVRAGGHIIESFYDADYLFRKTADGTIFTNPELSEFRSLNTRIAWGHGPLFKISEHKVDDNNVNNLENVDVQNRHGTKLQGQLLGFNETKVTRSIGTLAGASPIFNQTSQPVDAFEIAFTFPGGLFGVDGSGNLLTRKVDIKIEYRNTDIDTIYTSHTITVEANKKAPLTVWARVEFNDKLNRDIQVTRLTAVNTQDATLQDDYEWDLLVEVLTSNTSSYPFIANTGFTQFSQSQFQIPRQYSAICEGPTLVRRYSSITQFVEDDFTYTRNPAWLFLYWILHPIHGKGAFYNYENSVDIQSFINWASFCDELVSDGQSGVEPRCLFDFEVRQKFSIQDIVTMFSVAGHAKIFNIHGKWVVDIERAKPVKMVFTEGMYINGSLEVNVIHTNRNASVIIGKFRDASLDYEENSLQLVDINIPIGSRPVPKEVNLWGVTRQTQVYRILNRLLKKERLIDREIQFKTDLSGLSLEIGDVFGIASKSIKRDLGNGRIVSVIQDEGKFVLRLDSEVELTTVQHQLTIIHENSNLFNTNIRGMTTILFTPSIAEKTEFIDLTGIPAPQWQGDLKVGNAYSIIVFGGEDIEQFLCEEISVDENLITTVKGSKYLPSLFADDCACENRIGQSTIPNPNMVPGPVIDLTASDRPNVIRVIDLAWSPPAVDDIIDHYEIWRRLTTGIVYQFEGVSSANFYTVTANIVSGTAYVFLVRAVTPTGRSTPFGSAATVTHTPA